MCPDEIRILHAGRYLRLLSRNGWEYAERVHPQGAVIIVATTDDDRVLLVEQYRVPIQSRTLEFPAGLIGDQTEFADESLIDGARRELLEETGWLAARIDRIMGGPSSAGMSTEVMHFVRASGLTRVHAGGGAGDENITVHAVPRTEVARFVAARMAEGFAVDPKVYAGIYFLDHDARGESSGL
ncbi:MAG: NUDIX hydrolase [Xanthomonadales bacterium]|nr:hypothetical protein [Xanthomonadales bacterium]MCC6593363.1 NUDIX hydrolase [Xanthomonadales bacterium]MCE7930638.1 NUDIX hydrolase [Xanthomonadales bacterium PRO6]